MAAAFSWIVEDLLESVWQLEEESLFDPLSKAGLRRLLKSGKVVGKVILTPEGDVVGFYVYRFEADAVVLLRIVVARQHRRSGIATDILGELVARMEKRGLDRLIVDVPECQEEGLLFFRDMGMKAREVVPGSCCDNYRMVWEKPEISKSNF